MTKRQDGLIYYSRLVKEADLKLIKELTQN